MNEKSAWFRIGEILVSESKSEITPEQAVKKIREYIQQMEKPERKKGNWKLLKDGSAICSECKFIHQCVWDIDNWDNFCRHCGADMRG